MSAPGFRAGPKRFESLADWLRWQEHLHPVSMDLGLDRCRPVAERLGLDRHPFKLVTVGGTNGKGSCVAFMESILTAAGLRVGSYFSPHLLRYNERFRIVGREVDDETLIAAFAEIDRARDGISLTYFEFATLAAMVSFQRANLDVVLLEVGLGGRLDAVNLFDADVSVLTCIDLDHLEWLGPDRESVGREKAGILRAGRPAVCGEAEPPSSVIERAAQLDAPLYRLYRDINLEPVGETFSWRSPTASIDAIPAPNLAGPHQLENLALAITAVDLLGVLESAQPVRHGVPRAMLPGRFQVLGRHPQIVVDVAHNPHAARALARVLRAPHTHRQTHAFIAMLRDKDVTGVLEALCDVIDQWTFAGLDEPRGARRDHLEACASKVVLRGTPLFYDGLEQGYRRARQRLEATDRLVVFGSFYTAAHALRVETSR